MIAELRAWTGTTFALKAAASTSFAQAPSEQAAINAMRQVEQSWNQAIAEGRFLVSKCANETWKASRLTRGTVVKMDLQRSSSVLSPYVGIIELSGGLETNSDGPRASGFRNELRQPPQVVCYRSIGEALAATTPSDIRPFNDGRTYEMRAEYSITADGAKLARGNLFFNNALMHDALERPENASTWANVLGQPLGNAAPRSRQKR